MNRIGVNFCSLDKAYSLWVTPYEHCVLLSPFSPWMNMWLEVGQMKC